MVVFDTDVVSVIQRLASPDFQAVDARMRAATQETFYTSIITFEEQMRGWLAAIAKAKTANAEVVAYSRLLRLVEYFRDRPIPPFDAATSNRLRLSPNSRTSCRRLD